MTQLTATVVWVGCGGGPRPALGGESESAGEAPPRVEWRRQHHQSYGSQVLAIKVHYPYLIDITLLKNLTNSS